MLDAAVKIKAFNLGRDPDRLSIKFQKMRADPFVFLRGACHLFYERLPPHELFTEAPISWICGDLHLENFGSYKGDNRLTYFDINDFDEAVLAPCTFDLLRFLVSIQLGLRNYSVSEKQVLFLCRAFIDAYALALGEGKARWVERDVAVGPVSDLLEGLRQRTRVRLLDSRTELAGKRRRIRCDGKKALAVSDTHRALVTDFVTQFSKTQANPDFFKVLDVARRIAGTGSLGLDRYIVLVEGKGSPDANYLLDLKQATPSSLLRWASPRQPDWASEASRVVTLQQRMQAVSMAFLHVVELGGQSCILRALQPSDDRVVLAAWNGKLNRLEETVTTMGQVTAWAHLRGTGQQGSDITDTCVAFAKRTDWQDALMALALTTKQAVLSDWHDFADAFDQGYFVN